MRHKCLASFIVFVLFFTISSFIGFWQVRIITTARFLIQTLQDSKIYENLPQISERLMETNQKADPQAKIFSQIFIQSIDPKDLQRQVEKNIPLMLSYLKGKTPSLEVAFDLRLFKANVSENAAEILPKTLEEEIQKLPPCPADFQPKEESLDCLPPNVTAEQLKTEALKNANLDEMLQKIPDTYDLAQALPQKTLDSIRLAFQLIKIGYWGSLILSLILLGCLALLGRGYWPSIPRWIGMALILPAGSIFLLDLLWKFFQKSLQSQLTGGLNQPAAQLLEPFIQTIDQNALAPSLLISGTIFGIGALLIILSYAIPHPPRPPSQASGVAGRPEPKPQPQPQAQQRS